ncbi:hypothetical protein DYQ86_06590 [Acidobacteria bacterium AB60]|nr:hypothetical protein DYQ86_06590 [Acidobacteria bacterium AB60]
MRTYRFHLPLSVLFAAVLTVAGCHSNQTQPQTSDQASTQSPDGKPETGAPAGEKRARRHEPPPPQAVNLPAGTEIRVRVDQDLSSKDSQPGQSFSATVADDVTIDGKTVIAKGARADGSVVDAKPLGRFKGGALLAVKLDKVHSRWGSYPVETGTISKAEQGKGKRSAGFIGGGAGLGALIGGLAGGGKGAAIGALAGGGAGTAGSAFTGNKQIVIPAESILTFRLDQPIRIVERGPGEPDNDADTDTSADPALKNR